MEACEQCSSEQETRRLSIPICDRNEEIILCLSCRIRLFDQSIFSVSEPSFSETRKVSLTFTEEDWEWIDTQSKGNISRFLRVLMLQSKRF